ncbi:MAG: RuvX/YqgF family protein [Candidatus Pacebacteria bacterium]|nr:RuvX/YqgF family protein [Candidatus Paceibacterota bacterium]
MKYLGIDYGSIRVGIAESDDNGKIAFPVTILDNNKDLLKDILELIKALNIDCIVIGESLNLNGKENIINKEIKSFAEDLEKKSSKIIHFEKE